MKITPHLLSIPPYISTPWKSILSLYLDGEGILQVSLKNGAVVRVPHLSSKDLEEIFEAHSHAIEKREGKSSLEGPFSFSIPLNQVSPLPSPFEGEPPSPISFFGPSMEHNPAQSNLDPLPPSFLKKILLIAKAFGLPDLPNFPKGEPHCNCPSCQVARAISAEGTPEGVARKEEEEVIPEEPVSDRDLTFRTWTITPEGEKLYQVANPLDPSEQYQVFLGDPLGCTCGLKSCEHIRAVLNEPF